MLDDHLNYCHIEKINGIFAGVCGKWVAVSFIFFNSSFINL